MPVGFWALEIDQSYVILSGTMDGVQMDGVQPGAELTVGPGERVTLTGHVRSSLRGLTHPYWFDFDYHGTLIRVLVSGYAGEPQGDKDPPILFDTFALPAPEDGEQGAEAAAGAPVAACAPAAPPAAELLPGHQWRF